MDPVVTPAAVTESIVTTPAHVPTAEAPAAVVAPVVETPVAVETSPVVEAAVNPAAEPTTEEAAAKPELKLHTETKSLLEETQNEAAKVEGETPEGDKKPEGEKPVVEPQKPAEPVVYEMKLPENFEAPAENITAYTDILRESNIAPAVGQKLLDMHAEHVRALAENTLAQQHEVFAATRAAWRDEIKNDPSLGGASFETTKRAVARARDLIVPEADRAAFNEFLTTTGAGDHPAFWRALYRVSNLFDEPAAPAPDRRPSPNANPEPRRGVMGLFDKKSSNSFSSR
jgi:hypothetical protein